MNALIIQQTYKTPYVCCDASKGLFEIKGKCLDNNIEIMRSIMDWLVEYDNQRLSSSLTVNLHLEFFTTPFANSFPDVLKILERIFKKRTNVSINWFYDESDEDMLSAGEDFSKLIAIPFNFVAEYH
jgi:hypothetical protein